MLEWLNTYVFSETGLIVLVVLMIIAVVVMAYFILHFLRLYEHSRTRAARVYRELERLQYVINKNRKRIGLVERHAVDYYHSMSTEATEALGEALHILSSLEHLCSDVETLVATEERSALLDGEQLLTGPILLKKDALHAVRNDEPEVEYSADEYEDKLDSLLEVLGRDIVSASSRVRRISPQKRETRRTYTDLVAAGVRFARRHGRRISGTFISPFYEPSEADGETKH